MANLFLLVQTPRAGSKNHRFLVSGGAGLDEAEAARTVARALQRLGDDARAVGPDFLAVARRGVLQAGGGRAGDEVLLLGGIDTGEMPDEHRQQALARLEERLAELKEVIDATDWERSSTMLIEEQRLGEWLRRDFAGLVAGARSRRARRRIKAGVTIATLAAALCAVVGVARVGGWIGPGAIDSARATQSATNRLGTPTSPKGRFNELLRRWKLEHSREEAVRDLAAIAGLDDKPVDESRLLNDAKVATFLAEATSDPDEPPCLHFFEPGEDGRLRDLLPDRKKAGGLTCPRATGIRKCLYEVARSIREFREEAKTEDRAALAVESYPYSQMARHLATNPLEIPPERAKPVLPVFGRRDEEILDRVPPFLSHAMPKSVKDKIRWDDGLTLVSQLQLLKGQKKVLRQELSQNLNDFLVPPQKATRRPDEKQKEGVQLLSVKFETLLYQLADADLAAFSDNQ